MTEFQIIIPTMGGREKYLFWAIKSCLDQNFPDFEVIISNNGGSPAILDLVNSFADKRLLYFATEDFLPMAVHWEFALSKSNAKILTILGDDDALMPDALSKVADLYKGNSDIECITHSPGQYYWPDYYDTCWQNKFIAPKCSGNFEVLNPRKMFKKVAEFNEWYGKLPYLYHGFVKQSAIERIRKTQGLIFQRIYPDVYSDMALALTIKSYAHFDGSLTFGGQGAKSNGAGFFNGKTSGILSGAPSYLRSRYYRFNIQIQIYEFTQMAMERFAFNEKIKISWFKLIRTTIIEALTRNQEILENSIKELRRIIKSDSPKNIKLPALAFMTIFNSKSLCKLLHKVVESKKAKTSKTWRSASHEHGIANILDLVKLISHETNSPKI